jgi:hypothetical protein
MTLYRCQAIGVNPSTREWSFGIDFSSGSSLTVVAADWLTQITSFWTNGTHGVETVFPTTCVLETTRTASLAVVPVTIGGVTVNKIREQAVHTDNPALAGTSTNPSLPDQNVVLCTLLTTAHGRGSTARIHLPAPDQTVVTAGEIGATETTRVSTSLNALLVGMAAAGHQPVKVTGKVTHTGTPVGTTVNITGGETDRIVRTLRQRVKRRRAIRL